MVNINKEKIKEFLKPTRTKIIITLIPALAVLSFFAIEVNYYKIPWFGKSLEVLPFYILSCLITKTKRKISLPCETREDCQSICEEM